LSDSAEETGVDNLVLDLIAGAASLKLLITSREILNLPGEWQYPVSGLEVPDSNSGANFANFYAVHLFDICARRVRPGFSLSQEADGVIAICKAVEGIPLSIELAAT